MLSIVICSIDAAKFARVTANYEKRFAGVPHEIIGIHDARSLTEGYNRGWKRSRGETVLFSHDDVAVMSDDPGKALDRAFASLDVVGVVGTTRVVNMFWPSAGTSFLRGWATRPFPDGHCVVHVYGVEGAVSEGLQALDGFFFASRRELLEAHPFDEDTFDGFHGYDIDFTFSVHLAGGRVGSTAEIAAVHEGGVGYGDAAWKTYSERFQRKYRHVLPEEIVIAPWMAAAIEVSSADAIVQFDVPKLVKITQRLREAQGPA